MPTISSYRLTLSLLSIVAMVTAVGLFSSSSAQVNEQLVLPANDTNVAIFSRLPSWSLTDHNGRRFGAEQLYGKVWAISFSHTRCGQACSNQLLVAQGLQNALKSVEAGKDIHFVTISNEPDYDTIKVLSSFVKTRRIDTSNWHFLTGERDVISGLINESFKMSTDNKTHANLGPLSSRPDFVLVDWEGRIRGYYNAQTQDVINNFKNDLLTVVDERTAVPVEVLDEQFEDPRKQQQIETAKQSKLFTDFSFSDQLADSGITFSHKIIDDVGVSYKAVHYDHGNAIAIADVDSDGLLDLYFTTLAGSNELWRNIGGGKFENITDAAGLRIDDKIGMGASFADIDNDGDPDLYITSVRMGNQLFENDGRGRFKDITERSGTGITAHSSASVFFDYDRDGLLDLFVTNVGKYTADEVLTTTLYTEKGQVNSPYRYYVGYKDAFAGHLKPERAERSVLFKNVGNNTFKDVTEDLNLIDTSWTGDAVVIDANNDAWPDLYVLDMQGNDEYYENQQGKKFVLKSREVFPKTPWGAMGAVPFDYDNDGDLDLYITDMHSDMREHIGIPREKLKANNTDPDSFLRSGGNSIFGNAFYRNDGNGKYTEISDQIGLENYWPWGPGSGDLNADGYEDLFVASSMAYPFRYSINSVFLNDKGRRFVDSEYALGIEPRRNNKRAAPWFEIDCAGLHKGHAGCLGSETPGRTVVWGAVGTRSSAIFDLDNDGDQDIVTLEFNQPPQVLISNLSEQANIVYLKVGLQGRKSNKSGIGALVRVFAGEEVFTKQNDGKSGYLAQSDYPMYFGLGQHHKVSKIEVVWPSGITQTIDKDIKLNTEMLISEP